MISISLKEVMELLDLQCDVKSNTDACLDLSLLISGVAVDSRLVTPGNLFFALPGDHVDGHNFLKEAFQKGAKAAVVSFQYNANSDCPPIPLLRCHDVLNSLQEFARKRLANSSLRVVAVTGSVGKTTTKDFLSELLKQKYRVTSSPGNSNTKISLPMTILNHADMDGDLLVLEMGMTEPLQIARLVTIAPPEVSLVTEVALVHACYFNSLEEIAFAKAEVFTHPETKLGIYPHSLVTSIMKNVGSCPKNTFAMNGAEADFCGFIEEDSFIVKEKGGKFFSLPLFQLPGNHNYSNLLGAIAVARYFDVSWQQISDAQKKMQLPEKRMQIVEKEGIIFVNDSYNASEVSVKAALCSLPIPKKGGKRVAVLGEMLELGKFSKQCHEAVAKKALDCVDMMYCVGAGTLPILDIWQQAKRSVSWGMERKDIIGLLQRVLEPGDVVLLKGSSLKQMWKVLDEFNGGEIK